MQAIGYKEFVAAVEGTMTWREAEELVKLRSRQYAKRQLTWSGVIRRSTGCSGRKIQILGTPDSVRRNFWRNLG